MKLLCALILFFFMSLFFVPKTAVVFAQTPPVAGISNPNFNTLAPCPTCASPSEPALSGTAPSYAPGTNPVVSTAPCDTSTVASDNARHSKHKKHHGGISNLMKEFLQFFLKLINMLLQLLGGGSVNLPSSGQPEVSEAPAEEQPENPSQAVENPSQAVEEPSAAVPNPCPSAAAEVPGTSTAPASSPATTMPSGATMPSTVVPSGTMGQTATACGAPAPAAGPNAVITTADSATPLNITSGGTAGAPKIYDGGCHAVGWINIKTDNVVVQNFKVNADNQYGIVSEGTNITIQNNDIKNIHAPGDLNAITFWGNDTKILNNTAIDFITGDPGQSHSDAIQTWVSTSHPTASANVVIKGNKFTGPANPSRDNAVPSIHQCVMAEGLGRGGNSGGSGNPKNWLIADNYFSDSWGQCIKLDGIENVTVTRNEFAGSSDKIIDIPLAPGFLYYSDNKVTGTYKNGIGATVTQGAGPASLAP